MTWDEKRLRNITHDQLWKEVLWTFFSDFMQLFASHVARELDFGRLRRLDPEVFTDLPSGRKRVPDLVVEAHTRRGEPELFVIHVEVERRRRRDTPRRMWEYYALLRLRLGRPVYPIVVYLSRHGIGLRRETYEETLFGEMICSMQYLAIGVPDLSAHQYMKAQTALGAAMSALMVTRADDAVELTVSALERIAASGLDEARQTLLALIVENYARLTASDRDRVRTLLNTCAGGESMGKRLMGFFQKWGYDEGIEQGIEQGIERGIEQGIEQGVERGIQKGIEQGVAEGLMQGQRRLLLAQLRRRFGSLPPEIEAKIEAIRDSGRLDELALTVLDAASLDDLAL